jgi:hypothetical protein
MPQGTLVLLKETPKHKEKKIDDRVPRRFEERRPAAREVLELLEQHYSNRSWANDN